MLYALMAALPAAPGSKIVLATSGGSPGWLLGPLRFAGAGFASGRLAGPVFYAALWVALLLYALVIWGSRAFGVRLAFAVVAGLHILFLLAPPLLSQDVFSYIAYARLGLAHALNPYTHAPIDISRDAAFTHAGSIHAVSAYGPIFTLLTYPLSPLGVPAAFWILKVVAALASLGVVALVGRIARRIGREPVLPMLAVGLNPLVLVHVVGGAHNEALTMLIVMAGVLVWMGAPAAGTAVTALATGIKASAGIVLPFVALAPNGRPRTSRVNNVIAAIAALVAVAVIGLAAFGSHALDAFSLINSNQDRSSRFSIPHRIAAATGGQSVVRGVFAALFVIAFLWLLWRAWRGTIEAIDAIAWATLALLIASAWLVPWYVLWLLPFAALSRDRRLHVATLALSAWMLAIAVPL